jgi:hypothetical protein
MNTGRNATSLKNLCFFCTDLTCNGLGIFFSIKHCARAEKDPALRDDILIEVGDNFGEYIRWTFFFSF